jgi:hypothetical protein
MKGEVARTAKPANFKRLRIVVVVPLNPFRGAADFARASL